MRAPIDRPTLVWRAFVIGGIGTMKALSLSDTAWGWWEENVTTAIPRSTVRRTLVATVVVHVAEATIAHRRTSRAGLDHVSSWTLTTLMYGFPELGRIKKQLA